MRYFYRFEKKKGIYLPQIDNDCIPSNNINLVKQYLSLQPQENQEIKINFFLFFLIILLQQKINFLVFVEIKKSKNQIIYNESKIKKINYSKPEFDSN